MTTTSPAASGGTDTNAVTVEDVAALFAAHDPDARWWVTADEHALLEEAFGVGPERPDCLPMSARFAGALHAAGLDAVVVRGSDAAYPDDGLLDAHYWVDAGGLSWDWTVRQFYNVRGPAAAQALSSPVPLSWPAWQPHPLLGFRGVPDPM